MTRTTGIFLALIFFLAGGFPAPGTAAARPVPLTGTVTWVYDADTLDIAPYGKVRLLGIDAPEKDASDRDHNFIKLGIAARQLRPVHGAGLAWCIKQVKGVTVQLTLDRTEKDRYGRLLAYVRLPDGRLLNRLLLDEGLVIVYRRFPFDLKDDFLAAEAAAKKRGVGLWTR